MKKPDIKIGALMTCWNESKFFNVAMKNTYSYVDYISLVEGAYDEVVSLGANPFSDDGTLDIIEKWREKDEGRKIIYTSFNGKTDKDHRNVGLRELVNKECDWMVVVDLDELYPPNLWDLIYHQISKPLDVDVYYLKSMTFVNDLNHYTWQDFPRVFRVKPGIEFTNDNYIRYSIEEWPQIKKSKIDLMPFYHFAFMKGVDRFKQKVLWWNTRFGKDARFHYDWHIEEVNGKEVIVPENHKVYELKNVPKFLQEQYDTKDVQT